MGQRSAFPVPCCLMHHSRQLNSGIRPSSMKNVVIIACLLFGAFLVAVLCGADRALSGRVGISAVFFFTALGHFAKPEEMMHMLPAGVPQRRLVILLSGIFELVLATAVLISACFRSAGLGIW